MGIDNIKLPGWSDSTVIKNTGKKKIIIPGERAKEEIASRDKRYYKENQKQRHLRPEDVSNSISVEIEHEDIQGNYESQALKERQLIYGQRVEGMPSPPGINTHQQSVKNRRNESRRIKDAIRGKKGQ